jgi:hypothetical protein
MTENKLSHNCDTPSLGEGEVGGEAYRNISRLHFYKFDVQWAHLVALMGIVDRQ